MKGLSPRKLFATAALAEFGAIQAVIADLRGRMWHMGKARSKVAKTSVILFRCAACRWQAIVQGIGGIEAPLTFSRGGPIGRGKNAHDRTFESKIAKQGISHHGFVLTSLLLAAGWTIQAIPSAWGQESICAIVLGGDGQSRRFALEKGASGEFPEIGGQWDFIRQTTGPCSFLVFNQEGFQGDWALYGAEIHARVRIGAKGAQDHGGWRARSLRIQGPHPTACGITLGDSGMDQTFYGSDQGSATRHSGLTGWTFVRMTAGARCRFNIASERNMAGAHQKIEGGSAGPGPVENYRPPWRIRSVEIGGPSSGIPLPYHPPEEGRGEQKPPTPPPQKPVTPPTGDLMGVFVLQTVGREQREITLWVTGTLTSARGSSGITSFQTKQQASVSPGMGTFPGTINRVGFSASGLMKGEWSITAQASTTGRITCPANVPGYVVLDVENGAKCY